VSVLASGFAFAMSDERWLWGLCWGMSDVVGGVCRIYVRRAMSNGVGVDIAFVDTTLTVEK
jgi:hypothetical protein